MESITTWAETISRSSSPRNWIDALRQEAHLSGSHLHPLATGLNVVVGGDVGFETVPRFQRNTAYSAGGTVQVRKKFGLGAFVPVVTAEVGFQRREARIRSEDSWIATGALRLAQRFTDEWRQACAAGSTSTCGSNACSAACRGTSGTAGSSRLAPATCGAISLRPPARQYEHAPFPASSARRSARFTPRFRGKRTTTTASAG
jgi:hypothetical protein